MLNSKRILAKRGVQSGLVTAVILLILLIVGPVGASPSSSPQQYGFFVPPDTTPPTMSDITVCAITKTIADICWVTNEVSDSQVEYWKSPSLFSPLDETLVIIHLVHLTGLTPATTYSYKTMSRDARGNLAISKVYTFTTPGVAATFTASDLSITPFEVAAGEDITISVVVANTGDVKGTYEVTLTIDGAVEATKTVTIAAGGSSTVTFTTSRDVPGTYAVNVDGLSGSFTVREVVAPPAPPPVVPPPVPVPEVPPAVINWWTIVGGIIAGVIVVGLLVYFLWWRRRGVV